MDHQSKAIESRSSARIALQCSIIVANGIQTGDGQVLNVSERGCLMESSLRINVGDQLQLRLFLPERGQSICVSLALVQWAQASRFGVEFLQVNEKYRLRLAQLIPTGKDPWALAL